MGLDFDVDFESGLDEAAALALVGFFVFDAGLDVDGPAVVAGDPAALLGGLKGRCRRFWVDWRSGGMALASMDLFLVQIGIVSGNWLCCLVWRVSRLYLRAKSGDAC